jgi:hypothetical protein
MRFGTILLYPLKTKIMKKQIINNFQASVPDELKALLVAKKPTYIYTEEDLGEGILDAGVSC